MGPEEIGCDSVNWIELAYIGVQWWTFVNVVSDCWPGMDSVPWS
jgi:hypothetical protein